MGDFIKGPLADISLEKELIDGIRLHRAIDIATDAHPSFLQAKSLLPPPLRRFAGISIDIINDYFLSKNWSHYHKGSLDQFIEQSYQELHAHRAFFPPGFQEVVRRMREQDWLHTYQEKSGIKLTFERMILRRPKLTPMLDTYQVFLDYHPELEACFHPLYSDLKDLTLE